MSLESSSKLERVNCGAGSHWWRGWPEGSEVFRPECTDARPGNHKTGENLSKPESCDQKRYRKQLCQESFLLLARALSFWALWGSLSQLPEQMLSPKEPLLKYFLIYSEGAPTGGWKWVAVSFLFLASFFWKKLPSDCVLWFFRSHKLLAFHPLPVGYCLVVSAYINLYLKLIPASPDQQISVAWTSAGMNFLYLLHRNHYSFSRLLFLLFFMRMDSTRNYIQFLSQIEIMPRYKVKIVVFL